MAEVVAERPWGGWVRAVSLRWLPMDLVVAAYLAGVGTLIAVNHRLVPGAAGLLALHIAGIGLIGWLAGGYRARAAPILWLIRHWYPLVYIAACYREMALLIPAIRRVSYDSVMARLDLMLWGVYPTVWLERWRRAWLTEVLQIIYVLFFVVVIGLAVWLWHRGCLREYRYYAFVVSLGFLSSFVGYFLAPVRGPRFFLEHLHPTPLQGLWLFAPLHGWLDRLESVHYDCFPSGHVALTLLACWAAQRFCPRLSGLYWAYAGAMTFSTVYLRYHYTVDLLAGALLARAVWAAASRVPERPRSLA